MNQQIKLIRRCDHRVENIQNLLASDCSISSAERPVADCRQCMSEPDTGYSANYEDLCGPWSFPENPFHASRDVPVAPRLCVSTLLTSECIARVKNCLDNETAIKHLIGERLGNEALFVSADCRDIFLELVWSIIRFAKDNEFTEEVTSALVGIFHLTYKFFLSNPWCTVKETCKFFYESMVLHVVENPPESREIFTREECTRSVEFFLTILVKHLPLVRFVCGPNYRCVAQLPRKN